MELIFSDNCFLPNEAYIGQRYRCCENSRWIMYTNLKNNNIVGREALADSPGCGTKIHGYA
jgi:hypothetical protein